MAIHAERVAGVVGSLCPSGSQRLRQPLHDVRVFGRLAGGRHADGQAGAPRSSLSDNQHRVRDADYRIARIVVLQLVRRHVGRRQAGQIRAHRVEVAEGADFHSGKASQQRPQPVRRESPFVDRCEPGVDHGHALLGEHQGAPGLQELIHVIDGFLRVRDELENRGTDDEVVVMSPYPNYRLVADVHVQGGERFVFVDGHRLVTAVEPGRVRWLAELENASMDSGRYLLEVPVDVVPGDRYASPHAVTVVDRMDIGDGQTHAHTPVVWLRPLGLGDPAMAWFRYSRKRFLRNEEWWGSRQRTSRGESSDALAMRLIPASARTPTRSSKSSATPV